MGQGVCADYVFSVCCWICVGIWSHFKFVSVNGFLKCSLLIRSDLAPLHCINPPGFKLRGLSLVFLKFMCVSHDHSISFCNSRLTEVLIRQVRKVYGVNWLIKKFRGCLGHYFKVQGVYEHFSLSGTLIYSSYSSIHMRVLGGSQYNTAENHYKL